ncbi:MAG: DUF2703 domain-containing protein [Desulfovibrio sp.]|nr:DUF2703 domain-containing protein [Desulfovibrio sp.]
MSEQHRSLLIEWRHLDVGGATCDRCSQTGKAAMDAIERLQKDLNTCDVDVKFVDTALKEGDIHQSNMIILNGVPLESLLDKASVVMTDCASCGCIIGKETKCRAVLIDEVLHEVITADMIHIAALVALDRL